MGESRDGANVSIKTKPVEVDLVACEFVYNIRSSTFLLISFFFFLDGVGVQWSGITYSSISWTWSNTEVLPLIIELVERNRFTCVDCPARMYLRDYWFHFFFYFAKRSPSNQHLLESAVCKFVSTPFSVWISIRWFIWICSSELSFCCYSKYSFNFDYFFFSVFWKDWPRTMCTLKK